MANFLDRIFCHFGAYHCETPSQNWHLHLTALTVRLTGKRKAASTRPALSDLLMDPHSRDGRQLKGTAPAHENGGPFFSGELTRYRAGKGADGPYCGRPPVPRQSG